MYDVSTEEIAVELCSICKKNGYVMSEETQAEVEQGLFWLKCVAANEYNADHFRALLDALKHIVR